MAPATGTAILILGVFVLPGFVTLLFRERTYVVRDDASAFERLLTALYYSALIYVIALFAAWLVAGLEDGELVAFYEGEKTLGAYLLVAFIVGLFLPVVISEAGRLWMRSRKWRPWFLRRLGISQGHSTRSAWNEMFGHEGTAMIRVTLTDGRVVGGYYGPGSLASYSEHHQDLLISQRWVLDDDKWFEVPAQGSLGVWIPANHIASVELTERFDPPTEDDDGEAARSTPNL
jgi:hypothetical protein